jgi:WD40 repeat protein/transcriptional regulator with XRE-family HTH domain
MSRSLRVSRGWIERVKVSVRNRFGSQQHLAEEAGLARATVSNFLNGKPVDRASFVEICQRLELDWEEIADLGLFTADLQQIKAANSATAKIDWGDAIDLTSFYGRLEEVTTLSQWMVQDQCRLVALLGMGGIGKTALAVKVAETVQAQFEYVVWRSLRNTLPIQSLITDWILFLSDQRAVDQPEGLDEQLNCLLQYLQRHRCLLVLDNFESILQSGEQATRYLNGYEGYGQLLRRISDQRHQSCVLITSREKPIGLTWREDTQGVVRTYALTGLSEADGRTLLLAKGLHTSQDQLVRHYGGNPLALKIVATTIQSTFSGNIAEFWQQGSTVVGNIGDLLDQQFVRLSPLEQQMMYWLALHRDWVRLVELQADLVTAVAPTQLVQAVDRLLARSLIENSVDGYMQQPVVMEYVTARFIDQIEAEIKTQTPVLLRSHALLQAQAQDFVREAQSRAVLEPLANRLLYDFNGRSLLVKHLMQFVQTQRQIAPLQPGYLAGNLINLLCCLKTDLTGSDFSNLEIREAYLVQAKLHQVNFTGCHFVRSVFAETLTATLSVAFSSDGKQFACGNADGIARIWKTSDTSNLVTCKGHTSWVWAIAFSPDGQLLATGSFDQTIKIWDAETGTHLKTLSGHTDWIWSVAFSPDGRWLASGSNDRTVKLWNVFTGQCLQTWDEHTNIVNCVAFSPDGLLVVSASKDATLKLWSVETGQLVQSIQAHIHWIFAVEFTVDGTALVSGSHDQTIKVWDVKTAQCLKTLHGHTSYILSLALSSDGRTLASSSTDCMIRIWDLVTGECLKVLKGHPNGIWSVAFHPNGKTLISGSNDSMVKVWNVQTGQSLKTIQGYCKGLRSLAFRQAGSQLVSAGDDRMIRVWDIPSQTMKKTLSGHLSWVWSVDLSPDQLLIASGSNDCTVRIWQADTGKELRVLQGHTNLVMSVAFNPVEPVLISGSVDQTIRLWNLQTGRCQQVLTYSNRVWAVACSADGATLASGSDDTTIQLWDLKTGERFKILEGHQANVFSVAFSPTHSVLGSGSGDRTVKLWEIESGKCLHTLCHTGGVWEVAFSPDGQRIASASEDRTIKLWDVQTGTCLQTFQHSTGEAWAVAFSPDGTLLAGAGQNGIIHVWNTESGVEVATLGSKRPYEEMNIDDTTGLTTAQYDSLEILGAISTVPVYI